jgi:trans-2,3-dihydro-3-hydroxyanthranilate isomerase
LNLERWSAALRDHPTNNVFVFALDGERAGSDVRARMFGPAVGVPEDPATGSAAATLGGYLAARDPRFDGTLSWRVEQGFEMGRPSIIEIEVDKSGGVVAAVRVGGSSVTVCEGTMTLPDR